MCELPFLAEALCVLFLCVDLALVCLTGACLAEAFLPVDLCDAVLCDVVDFLAGVLRWATVLGLAVAFAFDDVRLALFLTGVLDVIETGWTWLVGVTLRAEGRLAPCVRARLTAGTVAIAITPAAAHFTNRLIIIGNSFAS